MPEVVSPKVAGYIERLNGSLDRLKAKAVEQKESAIVAIAAVGSAFGGAYFAARYPERKIAGADPDAVGAVLAGVGAAMTTGVTQTILGGVAVGLACSVGARMGAKKGEEKRLAAAAQGKP